MTKLHYVGFNGYHQCPERGSNLGKVITKWTAVDEDRTIVACTHRFIVLESNEVYNVYGVLNEFSKERVQVLTKPAKIDNFGCCDEFMITNSGKSIWRYNYKHLKWKNSELDFLNEEEKSVWAPAENRILKFSIQENHFDVILLLSNGSVWLLTKKDKLSLLFPNDLDKAVDVASGFEHSLILTESGCVLVYGNGSRGQLGLGDLNPASEPVQITGLGGLKVTKIAAGGWHSCAVTDSGDLYMWGWNNYGQLSAFTDKEVGLTALPMLVEVEDQPETRILDVACGTRHTVVTLENGDLYSAGWNGYCQLGIELFSEKITKFTKCNIKSSQNGTVICGPWYTILFDRPK